MANLISFSDLLGQSLDVYEKNWKKLTLLSVWLFVGILVGEIPYIGATFLAQHLNTGPAIAVEVLGMLLLLVCVLPPTIRLQASILKLIKGDSALVGWNAAFALLLPTALIGLLAGVIGLVGFILFILPGIWICTILEFSCFVLFDEGKKGFSALKRSFELVKGRWWGTFFRLVIPSLLITGVGFVVMAIGIVCVVVVGLLGTLVISIVAASSPALAGILGAVGAFLLILFGLAVYLIPTFVMVPLSIIPQAKLYVNLKDTR